MKIKKLFWKKFSEIKNANKRDSNALYPHIAENAPHFNRYANVNSCKINIYILAYFFQYSYYKFKT